MHFWKTLKHHRKRARVKRQVDQLQRQGRCRVIVGAASLIQPGWVGTDIASLNLLDDRDWQRYFTHDSVDAILAEHVWEHLTEEEGLLAARMCWRYLKPGGYLRLAVPDGFHRDATYIAHVRPAGTGPGADDHRVLYDYRSLGRLLEEAEFEVTYLEHFDEEGEFQRQHWDADDGLIHRSIRFDARNANGRPNYTSLIVDAHKRPLDQ